MSKTSDYIIAIDQGTTSSRVFAYKINKSKQLVLEAKAQKELKQIYPQKSWVEQCANDILQDIIFLLQNIILKLNHINKNNNYNIISIGITNQRETTILWDKTTNKPIHNAIVWQDRRTSEYCSELKQLGLDDFINSKTGLLIDPYFSASKINYLLNKYKLYNNHKLKNILFGTIDTFILYNLTNGKSHFTDSTNASRTMLYNINNLNWDPELLEIFNIPSFILPKVKNIETNNNNINNHYYGYIDPKFAKNNNLEKLSNTPITALVGDQQAASIGQLCFEATNCKITYGTGCFILQNTGDKIIKSKHKLISTIAYVINNTPTYALEGSIFIAGAAVQWLRDALKIINKPEDTEILAKSLEHNHGVYLIPAFTGLGAPFWDPEARGAILGITRDTGFAHIARAALESVVYQTEDILSAFKEDYSLPNIIKTDGGMSSNNWFMQFLADLTRIDIAKPQNIETTIFGAALLSALGVGVYNNLDEISNTYSNNMFDVFLPSIDQQISKNLYLGWKEAINRVKSK